jgi:transcription initiation factor IIE alpha subunit
MHLHLHCPACDAPLEVDATLDYDEANDYEPSVCTQCGHDLEHTLDRAVEHELKQRAWHGDPLDT